MNYLRCPRCGGFLIDAQERYWKWRRAFKDTLHCMNCGRNWVRKGNTHVLESFAYRISEYLERRKA